MNTWDPVQAQAAAQYLRLGKKEMTEIHAQPFAGKKAVSL